MKRHVIVISQDALVYEDLETLKTLPNYSKIWGISARVDRVRSVYPTLTYPAHTTMRTGVYPDRHGIINNEKTIIGQVSSPWELMNDAVKVPDLFSAAKVAGLTTAAVFWPVTGRHPDIDYLIDEYWPQSPDETTRECFIASGSSPGVMEKAVDPNLHMLINRVHPYCDAFINACACAIIREFKPNLLMIHPANIDDYRHKTGLFSPLVTHGLHEIDLWLGDIIKAAKDAGTYDDTDFFIVSDHGQLNISRTISPNVVFKEHGFIQTDANGQITDYTAFCKSTALSTQVYLKNPGDRTAYDKLYDLLKYMCSEGVYGISRVYTAEEVEKEEHLAGSFSFVLETDGYTGFTNHWMRPLVRSLDITDYRFGRATHGHHPDKGPQPTLIAFGPHIRAGASIDNCRLTDEAPTFARVLGVSLGDTDGTVVAGILNAE
jgi:predicted AlkP superfamily pyrophosphatase or phosphodiesterase